MTFTASNGWTVNEAGTIRDEYNQVVTDPELTEQVRTLLLEQRDAELGRWRDPAGPDYVVYPRDEGGVRVVGETTGMSDVVYLDSLGRGINLSRWHVARRYFSAHPKHKPLPTEPGLYIRDTAPCTINYTFRLTNQGWTCLEPEHLEGDRAKETAQVFHDEGQLVCLVEDAL